MSAALRELQEHVEPLLRAAGFELIEQVLAGDNLLWLDYRCINAEGPILFSLTAPAEAGVLVAELWRPGHLPEAHRLTWPAGDAIDQAAAVAEITRDVAGWLEAHVPAPDAGSTPCHVLLAEIQQPGPVRRQDCLQLGAGAEREHRGL